MVMAEYCAQNRSDIKVVVPTLAPYPRQAAEQLKQLILNYKNDYRIGVVGSSLGGYFSIWLNHLFDVPAVLINPAIRPYDLLVGYLGSQVNPYTNEHYELKIEHMDELKALDVSKIAQPQRLWLLQQEGDEVLDYRQAVEKLHQAKQTVEAGGDHSFVEFERYPQSIIQFLQL